MAYFIHAPFLDLLEGDLGLFAEGMGKGEFFPLTEIELQTLVCLIDTKGGYERFGASYTDRERLCEDSSALFHCVRIRCGLSY